MNIQAPNSFHANLALAAGIAVSITAETMEQLAGVVARLQGPTSAPADSDKVHWPMPTETKPAKVEAGKSATTGTPASAQPAASGSEAAAEASRPTYDDVKTRVLALARVKRELAQETLAAFKTAKGDKVDHGNKLRLEDYAAFIAAADKALGK